MHKRLVFNITSRILLIVCFCMLAPLGWAVHDNPRSLEVMAFVVTILAGLLISLAVRGACRIQAQDFKRINSKDTLAIVGLSWIVASLLGALPLYLSHTTAHFTDAFYEIVSGFTTTGASIFSDVETLPRGILFWRSLTNWLGGMGIIVLFLALLPALSQSGFQLYKAETSGIISEKIEPRIKETAKLLWLIYLFFSVVQTILHLAGGMTVFDALCHTFGAIATGGFSTKNASLGAFSPYHQWVALVFMFIGGVSFMLHYRMFRYGDWRYWRDEEFQCYSLVMLTLVAGFAGVLYHHGMSASPLRDAAFQVISISSSTGFSTVDFNVWPQGMRCIFLLLMISGACAGSTSGGLKIVRVILGIKIVLRSVLRAVFPSAVIPVKINRSPLANKVVEEVSSYIIIYLFLFLLGTFLLTVTDGCSFDTAFSATAANFGNIGPGLDAVGATGNYGWMSLPGKWVLIFLMLAGRLELYAFLILFVPATWRK